MAEALSDHHVKFATGTHLDPEPIHVVRGEDPTLLPEVHVGILQKHHTYCVTIPIPHSLGPAVSVRLVGECICFTVVKPPDTVERVDVVECKYVTDVKLQAKTDLEGKIAEAIELYVGEGENPSSSLKLLLTAKVIKCNEGTPVLKDGVHVISHHHSEECAIREWPGYWNEEPHVRFTSDTQLDPEPIRLSREDSTLPPEIYVGILRSHHTYSVDVPIPHTLGPMVSTRIPDTNLCFTVMEPPKTVEPETGMEDGDKYVTTVKLQVKTLAEGNIVETMELFVEEGGQPSNAMEVLLTAKVIKCNDGNPRLKDGVHVIAHQHSEACVFKEWPGSYEENHVRFASGTVLDPQHVSLVREDPSLPPEAHVGILRHYHTYGVDLPIPHSLGPVVVARPIEDSTCLTVMEPLETVKRMDDGGNMYTTTVKLQVKTVMEGSISETLELNVDGGDSMVVVLTAKVIKCNQGVPLLKEGVRVIDHHHSEECTVKEWPKEEEHHVRFATGTHLDPEPIRLSRDDPTSPPEVHVGILRSHHTYGVNVPIPRTLGPVVSIRMPDTNLCFALMEEAPKTVKPETGMEDGVKYVTTVKLQVKTLAEGNIVETMELFVEEGGQPSNAMEVLLTAKVIKCNDGNPRLKDGVHIIAHQHSEACGFKEWPGSYKENRVKFASDTHLDPDPIHLVRAKDSALPPEAHVGILLNHHTYSISIPTPHSLGSDVSARHAETNIYFTVTEPPVTVKAGPKDQDKYISTIKLQAKTVKEGSIAEKIEIFTDDGKESMEVLLTAKVIKTNQGTPLLKDGVRMLSHEHSEESDYTEWQGFQEEAGEEMEN